MYKNIYNIRFSHKFFNNKKKYIICVDMRIYWILYDPF